MANQLHFDIDHLARLHIALSIFNSIEAINLYDDGERAKLRRCVDATIKFTELINERRYKAKADQAEVKVTGDAVVEGGKPAGGGVVFW